MKKFEIGIAYAIYNKNENAVGEYEIFTADNYQTAEQKFDKLVEVYPIELPICLYSNDGQILASTLAYTEEYQKVDD